MQSSAAGCTPLGCSAPCCCCWKTAYVAGAMGSNQPAKRQFDVSGQLNNCVGIYSQNCCTQTNNHAAALIQQYNVIM